MTFDNLNATLIGYIKYCIRSNSSASILLLTSKDKLFKLHINLFEYLSEIKGLNVSESEYTYENLTCLTDWLKATHGVKVKLIQKPIEHVDYQFADLDTSTYTKIYFDYSR